MSAPPQASGGGRLETNMNPCPPRSGEGQKSLYSLLIGSPTLTGAPKGPSGLARPATQMSRPPSPPGRFEAMYNCSPSRERIGQPSRNGVFSSELVPGTDSRLTAGPQAENEGAASAGAATSRSRALASTPTSSASATTIKNLCLFILVSPSLADGWSSDWDVLQYVRRVKRVIPQAQSAVGLLWTLRRLRRCRLPPSQPVSPFFFGVQIRCGASGEHGSFSSCQLRFLPRSEE